MPVKKRNSKWRPPSSSLVDVFERAIQSRPDAEKKKMFGCPCVFLNGNMVAAVHGVGIIIRLSEADRNALVGSGAEPFEPTPGRIMREYVVAPEPLVRGADALVPWLAKAFAYVATLPAKASKGRQRSKGVSP